MKRDSLRLLNEIKSQDCPRITTILKINDYDFGGDKDKMHDVV